ncbi:MAG: CopD family protein [Methylophilaceae bacterium]|jgi:putative membrane protein|nr:CopD family protein [Methylophilaceae bacterium]
MLWMKSLHIIFMVTWFAGLFYLPRLYVYHAETKDKISNDRFKVMERKLFYGIMTPGGILTIFFGLLLIYNYPYQGQWLTYKLILVFFLIIYHLYCWKFLNLFKYDKNYHSHVFYRIFNEVPVIILIAAVFLVIYKP